MQNKKVSAAEIVNQKVHLQRKLHLLIKTNTGVERLALLQAAIFSLVNILEAYLSEISSKGQDQGVNLGQLARLTARGFYNMKPSDESASLMPEFSELLHLKDDTMSWLNELLDLNFRLPAKALKLSESIDIGSVNTLVSQEDKYDTSSEKLISGRANEGPTLIAVDAGYTNPLENAECVVLDFSRVDSMLQELSALIARQRQSLQEF